MTKNDRAARNPSFWRDEKGATAVEYGLIVAVIASGLVLLIQGTTGEKLQNVFYKAAAGFDSIDPASSTTTLSSTSSSTTSN